MTGMNTCAHCVHTHALAKHAHVCAESTACVWLCGQHHGVTHQPELTRLLAAPTLCSVSHQLLLAPSPLYNEAQSLHHRLGE